MAFDLSLFGSKLKRYREQFQRSLDEISQATGISQESLSQLENGQRRPTGDEVLILADYYKCDYKFFISNEQVAPFEQTGILFRRYGESFSKQERWFVQEFLFLCECEEFLMRLLSGHDRKPFQFVKQGNSYKEQGEQASAALREYLGYSFNEINMDVYEDFRRIGVHVFRRQIGNSNISGLFIKHPFAGKCVLINYSEDVYRQRFTASHEIAHTILDDEDDVVVSFSKSSKDDYSEIRANNFASRYLMPPEFLQRIPDANQWTPEKAIDWANRLKVSTEALAYALKSLNLISDETVAQLKAVRVPTSSKVDPELPESLPIKSRQRREEMLRRGLSTFYVGLCFDAYEQGIISAGRLASMLLVDEHELIAVSSTYGRNLRYGD